MKTKIRLVTSGWLILGMVVVFVFTMGSGLAMIIAAGTNKNFCKPSDVLPIQLLCGFWMLVGAFGFWNARHVFSVITLTAESITIQIPFGKKACEKYSQYPNVFIGKYYHGNILGMGKWNAYIVFSKRKLSPKELETINEVPNSLDTFKIRYCPRNIKLLASILPETHRYKLNAAIAKK